MHVPTLQERATDIPLLATNILKKLAKEQHRDELTLSPEALQTLQAYPFPGNVRELENILERSMALCNGSVIEVADLQLPTSGINAHIPAPIPASGKIDLESSLQEHE